ncbi:MAG: lyase [Bacilli bacterium]|nr:lyase [Bacilli bacterium]
MKIISIEPTPSPNTMKLNMDIRLPDGARFTYTLDNIDSAPDYSKKLLAIPGVTGLFQAADFIALDRHSKGDWQQILEKARDILGSDDAAHAKQSTYGDGVDAEHTKLAAPVVGWGEVQVRLQQFRHIPMQVRVSIGTEEQRAALPEKFIKAATQAGLASPNLIKERKLIDYGVRYGELQEVLEQIVNELDAAYDDNRLLQLAADAMNDAYQDDNSVEYSSSSTITLDQLSAAMLDADWRVRYAALRTIRPSLDAIPFLAKALDDPHISIRRMAAVYLGDIKEPQVLPYLYKALTDKSPAVRRTAGDTLSDLGDPAAIGAMCKALQDTSKIVRWRAARFLYEVGDETAIPALREAQNDPEFEVRMQLKLALERIEGGEAAVGSVWQQMTQRDKTEKPPVGN